MQSINRKRFSPVLFFLFLFLVIGFRLWLIAGIPKMILYTPHDDLYFAKAADSIIHGEWLGTTYTQMTLIKGPFYAFFLIGSFLTGLPLFFNETVFYVIGCFSLFIANKPVALLLLSPQQADGVLRKSKCVSHLKASNRRS